MTDVGRVEHVPYDQTRQPYHVTIADLAARYAPRDGTVLDVGCGVGHILDAIRERRPDLHLVGVDDDATCLGVTEDRLAGSLRTVQLDLAGGPSIESDLPGADVAVLSHVLEHLLEPHTVLRSVMARVSPGGFVILAVPNPVRPAVIAGNLRRRRYSNEGHVYAWDRSHWENYLERVLELDIIEYTSDYVPLFPESVLRRAPWLRQLELYLARRFPWFAFSHIAVVRVPA